MTKISTDCYFEMGAHQICEDYALTGNIGDELYYALISDGCSSSPNTDVGSRLLCHSAEKSIRTFFTNFSPVDLEKWKDGASRNTLEAMLASGAIMGAQFASKFLHIDSQALDCTLLMILSTKKHALIFGWGDGSVIINGQNEVRIVDISYQSGAPYYLSYQLDAWRKDGYNNCFNMPQELHRVSYSSDPLPVSTFSFAPYHQRYSDFIDLQNSKVSSVAITSDGINTYKKDCEPIEFITMAKEYIAYKNFNGEFVKRRMGRIKRDCDKDKIVHEDDISCATIHYGE